MPAPAEPPRHPLARAIELGTSALFLAVAAGALDILLLAAALGGFRPLLAHRPALTMLVVWGVAGLYGATAHPRTAPRPLRRAAEPSWVVAGLAALPFATLFLSAWSERHAFAPIPGGAALAWCGVALASLGAGLRTAAVVQLGRHFTPCVLVEEQHVLNQSGVYRRQRHPGYLGALLGGVGAALVFRSGPGLALALAMLIPLRVRIRGEERLLAEHFGADYEEYRRRTSGLWPRWRQESP